MTFLVDASVTNLTACLRLGGTIWNWTLATGKGGWELLPATGTPLAAHLRQLVRTASGAGSLGNECTLQIPDAAAFQSGAWVSVFSCDASGAITGNPSDLIYCVPIATGPPVSIAIGGVAR